MNENTERGARMEMKTHTLAVMVSAGWPLALSWSLITLAVVAILPLSSGWTIIAVMAAIMLLMFLLCVRMYLGTYLFLPATEYKGARIIARLGRSNDVDISGVLADEIIVKQGWIEKRFHVCHIRQKGTGIYLRGVKEPERVKSWVAANFPASRPEPKPVKRKKK